MSAIVLIAVGRPNVRMVLGTILANVPKAGTAAASITSAREVIANARGIKATGRPQACVFHQTRNTKVMIMAKITAIFVLSSI